MADETASLVFKKHNQLVNVVVLGLAFHLIFFAFQTSVFIQQTVVSGMNADCAANKTSSINTSKQQPSACEFNAYLGLCITYGVFAAFNWLAPSLVALIGAKSAMFVAALSYVFYELTFIEPSPRLLYASATLIGVGAAVLWTAQGNFLAANSNAQTSSRNSSIFWSLLQSSMLFGNLFVFFAFSGETRISDHTRRIVFIVLSAVCASGAFLLLTLRTTTTLQQTQQTQVQQSSVQTTNINSNNNNNVSLDSTQHHSLLKQAVNQFISSSKLACTRNIALLTPAFVFTGLLLTFFTGVFGTAIGATPQFGANAKRLIGVAGICIGIGELLGGFLFGVGATLLSQESRLRILLTNVKSRSILFVGLCALLLAFCFEFINFAPDSASGSTTATGHSIIQPSVWLALVSAVLIGFGDACFNTQIFAILITYYSNNSLAAFALFKFSQSLASAIAFFYSTLLDLRVQLYLLVSFGCLAAVCFSIAETKLERKQRQATIITSFDNNNTISQQSNQSVN